MRIGCRSGADQEGDIMALALKIDYWTGEGYRRPDFVPYQT
jgi:hypothetical protein